MRLSIGTVLVALAALVLMFEAYRLLTNSHPAHLHEEKAPDTEYYTCPMHPSVRQVGPGKCPLCGMDLTPVKPEESSSGEVVVNEARRQRIGVRLGVAEVRPMIRHLRVVGAVRYDETRLHDVNLRMSGWVQSLLVNQTEQPVKAGQTLFTLYSPELYAAQLEHLSAMRRAGGDGATTLVQASKKRLELLGMSEAQIEALGKRGTAQQNVAIVAPTTGFVIDKQVVQGARVEAGTRVYQVADLSQVWIEAQIDEVDLPLVRAGQAVTVQLPSHTQTTYQGELDYVYPVFESQTRTARARIVLKNTELTLKPNMFVNVKIAVDLGQRLSVADSAVIYTGPRRLVFVDLGEGKLLPKEVSVGVHADGYYEITSGLKEGERVVVSGNFLVAAESRIQSAVETWGSHDGAH